MPFTEQKNRFKRSLLLFCRYFVKKLLRTRNKTRIITPQHISVKLLESNAKPKVEKTLENLLNECRRCKASSQTLPISGAALKLNLSGKRTETGFNPPLILFKVSLGFS